MSAALEKEIILGQHKNNKSSVFLNSPGDASMALEKNYQHPNTNKACRNHVMTSDFSNNLTTLNTQSMIFLPEQVGNVTPNGESSTDRIDNKNTN